MEPIKHPDANHALRPPVDWDEEKNGPCATLEVFAQVQGSDICIQSTWMPNAEELAALNAGQPVVLMVYGRVIPPMAVGVLAPPEEPKT